MLKACSVVILIIAVNIVIIGTAQHLINDQPPRMTIETKGLTELEIDLEAPYGEDSMEHVLLINRGSHYLLACEIEFEVTTNDGRVLSAKKVLYSFPLLENNSVKRMELLKSEPGIGPNSRWLVGFDQTGLEQIGSTVPPLKAATLTKIFPDPKECKQLVITLTGAVIETGEAYGPLANEFLQHMRDDVLKEKTP